MYKHIQGRTSFFTPARFKSCLFFKFLLIYSKPCLVQLPRPYSFNLFISESSKSAFFHALTVSLLPKNHMLFIVSKQCACSRRVHIEGHMNRFEYCHPDKNSDNDSFGSFLSYFIISINFSGQQKQNSSLKIVFSYILPHSKFSKFSESYLALNIMNDPVIDLNIVIQTRILITIVLGLFCQKNRIVCNITRC
jgi:hypothetical protein